MSQTEFKQRLKALMSLPENQVCCDCNERRPTWASLIVPPPGSPLGALPIGALCCLDCSGSHRKLGVHITFVRSISLDTWKEKEVIAMEQGGNLKVNAIFEAIKPILSKPTSSSSASDREKFITEKYEMRRFFDPDIHAKYLQSESYKRPIESSSFRNSTQLSDFKSEAERWRADAFD